MTALNRCYKETKTSVKHQTTRLGLKVRRGLSTMEAPKQTRVPWAAGLRLDTLM